MTINRDKKIEIILTGTDPASNRGGIAFAIPGYISAIEKSKLEFRFIPTYSPDNFFTKHFLFLVALPEILSAIRRTRANKNICFIYSHAGAGISIFREGVILMVSRLSGAKTAIQIHSSGTLKYLASPFKNKLFKLALTGVQNIFVLTPWWKTVYLKNGITKPIDVVPNSLPASWENKASGPDANKKVSKQVKLLVMSRLIRGKGVDLVIEAMPFLPDKFHLSIAGDGPIQTALKSRVDVLGLEDRITFCGWVSGNQKQILLDEADIFCHFTSLDAMPMNILEAMANGLPIAALNWGPISDLVLDGHVGKLLNNKDAEKIAQLITELSEPETIRNMGIQAKKWVLERYTSKKVGSDLKNIFSRLSINEK